MSFMSFWILEIKKYLNEFPRSTDVRQSFIYFGTNDYCSL